MIFNLLYLLIYSKKEELKLMNSNKIIPILGLLLLLILAIGSISASDINLDSNIMGDSSADIDLISEEPVINEISNSNTVDEDNAGESIDESILNLEYESDIDSTDTIEINEKDSVGAKSNLGANNLASTITFKEKDYLNYFDAKGNIVNGKLNPGDTLTFSGKFNNKNFIINIPLIITADSTVNLNNCQFSFVDGSNGSTVSNLKMNNSVAEKSLLSASDVSNITFINNNLFSSGRSSHPMEFSRVSGFNILYNTLQTTGYVKGWGHPSAMVFRNAEECNISGNTVITNDSNGIYFTSFTSESSMGPSGDAESYSNYIFNNTVFSIRELPSSYVYAIQVMSSSNLIINNTVYNAYRGISTTGLNNQIIGNNIYNIHGAYYSQSSEEEGGDFAIITGSNTLVKENVISNCIFNGKKAAIRVGEGSNVINNTLINVTGIGAYLDGSDINFTYNDLNVGGYGVYIYGEVQHIIVSNNTIFSNNQSNVKLEKQTSRKFPNHISIINNTLHNLGAIPINLPVESNNVTIDSNNIIIEGIIDYGIDNESVHYIFENNFYKYFSSTGALENNIKENDTLVFIGSFSSKGKLDINQKVNIIGFDAIFSDTTFLINNDDVSIENINISNPNNDLKDRLWGIQVNGVKNVTIKNCDISIHDPYSAYAIYLLEASDCLILNNTLEAKGNYFTAPILSFNSRDILIDGNTIKTIGSGETYLINNKSCLDGFISINSDACVDGSITCPDGYDVCPDGSIMCPDGTIIDSDDYYICVDGSIVCADGSIICPDGTALTGEICPDGVCVDGVTYCLDGTIILANGTKVYAGGYQITAENEIIYPNGTTIGSGEYTINETDGSFRCPDGTVICTDGSVICSDGTVICPDGAGSSNVLDGVIPGTHMVSGVFRTYGVLLVHSSNVNLTNNKINVSSDLPSDYKLNESYNSIAGVFIHYGGFNNTISNNAILLHSNDPVIYGIGIIGASPNSSAVGSKNNSFINNNLTLIGPYNGVGIILGYKAIDSRFLNNNIGIYTKNAFNVLTYAGSENNAIEGNTFSKKLNTTLIVSNSSYKLDNLNKIITVSIKDSEGKFLANKNIIITVNGQNYTAKTDKNGIATVKVSLSQIKAYDINAKFEEDIYNFESFAIGKITVTKGSTSLTSSGKTYTVTATSKKITVTLKDGSGKVIANRKVTATVNGKTYKATTNSKGVATFKLTLKTVKTYKVSLKFAGDSYYTASSKSIKVKVTKTKTKLTVPKKTYKAKAKVKKLTATLKDQTGKVIKSKKVTFIVNKKKYTAKTNKKGVATVKVKLSKKKTYKFTVKFAGDKTYYSVKKTGKVVIK